MEIHYKIVEGLTIITVTFPKGRKSELLGFALYKSLREMNEDEDDIINHAFKDNT